MRRKKSQLESLRFEKFNFRFAQIYLPTTVGVAATITAATVGFICERIEAAPIIAASDSARILPSSASSVSLIVANLQLTRPRVWSNVVVSENKSSRI